MYRLEKKQFVPRPLKEVFSFFGHPENLRLLTPVSLDFTILTPSPIEMKAGALIDYTIRILGMKLRWTTRILEYKPPHFFSDEQLRGPYARWHHTHLFSEIDGGTEITDRVEYDLPFGVFGKLAHRLYVQNDLDRIFNYRTKVIQKIFD